MDAVLPFGDGAHLVEEDAAPEIGRCMETARSPLVTIRGNTILVLA
jgi:hypothetical protein